GITEAPARVIRALYDETAALGRALGHEVVQYEDRDFRNPGTIMAEVFRGPFHTQRVIGEIKGPSSIESRYITEDLPYGLVPMSKLGDVFGVETPLINAIITLGSYVCDRDFWSEGRTLAKLGLDGLDEEGIISYVGGE
ncbi:MAG: NAD/NADP octopine/nopaline dehydrogenase family protein, partial [Bacillota bacterium]